MGAIPPWEARSSVDANRAITAIAEAAKQFGQHDDITVLTLILTTPSLKAALA
jgi:hypothetical protein